MLYEIGNSSGIHAVITTVGASIASLWVPGGDGSSVDVVLGLSCEDDYRDNPTFMGASVGRVVNRIAGARFSLQGREYELTANDGANCNHGGRDFWAMREWSLVETDGDHVVLSLHSPAGDQGFPGTVEATATYRVDGDVLELTYTAITDEPTLVNMTNHAYFNLNGHASGAAMGHLLSIDAEERLASDETVLPTGEVVPVTGTAWDFRKPRAIYAALPTSGFDTCFVLSNEGQLRHAARLVGEQSGVVMDLLSDQPGMQLYTANFTVEDRGKDGVRYRPREAVCLEPGFFPDAIHHPEWPQPIVTPGKPYLWRARYEFPVV